MELTQLEVAAKLPTGKALAGALPGSETRLVRRAAAGDERAFAAIFNRYHQELYRFCLAILRNSADAQDALQNAMVKALSAIRADEGRGPTGASLKPWLYRIAHNESIELLRRRQGTEELDPDAITAISVTDEVEQREELRQLVDDLAELPERQRASLVMRELSGFSFEEVAAALGTSSGVARQAVYEARLNLREMEEGREMTCDSVTKVLSEGDGRVARRGEIRAHLRHCPDCRRFRDAIDDRGRRFAALAPLPAVAATGLLAKIGVAEAAKGAAASGAGATGAAGAGAVAGAAKPFGVAALLKTAATVATVAAVGAGAERSGLVDVVPGGGGGQAAGLAPAMVEPAEMTDSSGRGAQANAERSRPPRADRSGKAVPLSDGVDATSLPNSEFAALPPVAEQPPKPEPVEADSGGEQVSGIEAVGKRAVVTAEPTPVTELPNPVVLPAEVPDPASEEPAPEDPPDPPEEETDVETPDLVSR